MSKQIPQSIKILIAEDDYLVALLIKKVVLELGYHVLDIAANGQQALIMTCQNQPDVVLMDIDMPIMDGLEATTHINTHCPTPVIALTAYTSQHLVQRASQVGIEAYVIKPPQPQELHRAIILALARFEKMQTLRQSNQNLQA